MNAVSLARVTKRFGATIAVTDLSLEIETGEMFGLIGPDGAGKSTTIRLICGLIHADSGNVTVLGKDAVSGHRLLTQKVGYLPQRFSLYGDLSIDENIEFFASIHGVPRFRERRNRLLDIMQLTPFRSRLAARLSGGMKQKLALACTLVHEPQLLLLDEPTTGVDPVSRRGLWKLLSDFRSEGITMVMTTPYLDEAERCSRVALMHEGRMLALDTPGALRHQLAGEVIEVIARPQERAATLLSKIDGVSDVQIFGERLHVRLRVGSADVIDRIKQALASGEVQVASVRAVLPSLEDVFIERLKAG